MADATLISRKEVGTSGLKQYQQDVPSVAVSAASGRYRFVFDDYEFNFEGLRIACNSTDFDFLLFDKDGVSTPTAHMVLERNSQNLFYGESALNIAFINNDTTQGAYLYGEFHNNDSIHATGTITCAFLVR
jgi:hypothetical protein